MQEYLRTHRREVVIVVGLICISLVAAAGLYFRLEALPEIINATATLDENSPFLTALAGTAQRATEATWTPTPSISPTPSIIEAGTTAAARETNFMETITALFQSTATPTPGS